jgi:DMSO reductase anchor subunit
MHPALSVIFFTTLSGAGLGLLALVASIFAVAPLPLSREYALTPWVAGVVLLCLGLFASLMHLGQPQRAWRALSQWRSSWLSREGVSAILTLMLSAASMACVWSGRADALAQIMYLTCAASAALTVLCTARIYDTLKPIAAWYNAWVLPAYALHALLSGGVWLWALLSLAQWPLASRWAAALLVCAVLAWLVRMMLWRHADAPTAPDTGAATGLAALGRVRGFEAPHTESNYLLREMGYVLARKHARRLRGIAVLLAYVVPAAVAVLALWRPQIVAGLAWPTLIVLTVGLFVERWLFFAQARHAVVAYYPEARG